MGTLGMAGRSALHRGMDDADQSSRDSCMSLLLTDVGACRFVHAVRFLQPAGLWLGAACGLFGLSRRQGQGRRLRFFGLAFLIFSACHIPLIGSTRLPLWG